MKRSFGVVSLLLLGLAAPACESGGSGGSDLGFSSDQCSDACLRIDAARCGDVDSTCVDACVHHVSIAAENDCPTELRLYLDCFWTAAAFACDAETRTQAVGCEAQITSYEACIGGGAGGAAGAPDEAAAGAGGASAGE